MVDDNAVPPVEAVYHCNPVPLATKLLIEAELQKDCADAVGGVVVFTVTATIVLALSQEFKVCDT